MSNQIEVEFSTNNLEVNLDGNKIELDITTVAGTSGEKNTASNLGAGEGIFAQKNGVDLELKSLVAGNNVTLTSSSTGVTIATATATVVTKITEDLTLTATNIANKYIDLANTPQDNTAVGVFPVVGIKQLYTTDFTVITDGVSIKRLNWDSLTLETLLSEGDILSVDYIY